MDNVLLIQLPLHPFTAWEPTGNIPLASALLAAAANLPKSVLLQEEELDNLGDAAMFKLVKQKRPSIVGVTLYLWNRERTLNLLRKLKEWDKGLIIVAGGPEVTTDNADLLAQEYIDVFVVGEGEPFAKDIFSYSTIKTMIDNGKRVIGPATDLHPPNYWPDPYEQGLLTASLNDSVHIETQRGCSSKCTYCAYRKSSPTPRIVPAEQVLDKVKSHYENGVSELVFLDPTFNKRPDLSLLLEGLSQFSIDSFAEIRADLIHNQETSDRLYKAGFKSLEVGLQTFNQEVLRSIGRGGNPRNVLRGAIFLKESGITPIIDLILGLPGDSPQSIIEAANQLVSEELNEQVQSFILSILPGTELKRTAIENGLEYNFKPPYNITKSGIHSLADLLQAREDISDIVGYDPDPPARPVFSNTFPSLELFIPEDKCTVYSQSVRHGVLRIKTADAWRYREAILRKIKERRDIDPYCPLDIIIESEVIFPLDLLEMISVIEEPTCYTSEKAKIYSLPGLIRLGVVAPNGVQMSWLQECSEYAVTVLKSAYPVPIPGGMIGLLIEGKHNLVQLSTLYAEAAHLIFFADENLERLWNLEILDLG